MITRKAGYAVLFLSIATTWCNTMTVSLRSDEIDTLASTLTTSIKDFMRAYQPPSAPTILALVTGIYSTRALYATCSKKAADRTTVDWAVPTAGLTLSAMALYLLSK